jgi:signal transduction histidine kinase
MMLTTLRGHLILSHVLVVLVIVPVMGLALIYVLETQVILSNLASELTSEALLLAEFASTRDALWADTRAAQDFVTLVSERLGARVMLLDARGYVIASSDLANGDRLGQLLDSVSLSAAQAEGVSVRTSYSQRLHHEVVDVVIPVSDPGQQVAGFIRLSRQLTTVYEQFLRLRYLIAGVLLAGLALGSILGWALALNMERPLRYVTQAIHRLADSQQLDPLPEQGPEEIRTLAHTVNTLVLRLRSLEQARSKLLANLVHELGRPLGALHSAIQALLSGADEDPTFRRDLLAGMEGETDRLRRLLEDLAGLHDQVLGTLELDRRPTAVGDWLSHTLSPWREAAQEKGLHWEADLPVALPTLQVDPDRLGQAIGNLLSNAIKYTPPRGTVSIAAGVEGGSLWVRVSDTGPGIAPEEQAHIFTPFYRGQPDRRFPQGMGLGLSIARDLILAHGGQLEVDSSSGLGSQFTVSLPL